MGIGELPGMFIAWLVGEDDVAVAVGRAWDMDMDIDVDVGIGIDIDIDMDMVMSIDGIESIESMVGDRADADADMATFVEARVDGPPGMTGDNDGGGSDELGGAMAELEMRTTRDLIGSGGGDAGDGVAGDMGVGGGGAGDGDGMDVNRKDDELSLAGSGGIVSVSVSVSVSGRGAGSGVGVEIELGVEVMLGIPDTTGGISTAMLTTDERIPLATSSILVVMTIGGGPGTVMKDDGTKNMFGRGAVWGGPECRGPGGSSGGGGGSGNPSKVRFGGEAI
jgi:hypothetical protein